jgi:hypothetical protein
MEVLLVLNQKLPLTNELIALIQKRRFSNTLKAADLSLNIGKPAGFISAAENKRIKTIALPLLIRIFQAIDNNRTEEEIVAEVEDVLAISQETHNSQSTDSTSEDDNEDFEYEKKNEYCIKDDFDNPYLRDILIQNLSEFFKAYYEVKQMEAADLFATLFGALKFDVNLMRQLIRLPYYKLKPLSKEERKTFLKEMYAVFEKHLDIAKSKPVEDSDSR